MKRIIKNKRGFTLIEAMISVAIAGILTVGVLKMFQDGIRMWNYGSARMAIQSEARMSMVALTKFIHAAQGSTISISRINANQPVQSFISAKLNETIFITTQQNTCGCSSDPDVMTVGDSNDPETNHVKIFQVDNHLYAATPHVNPGTDLRDPNEILTNTYYSYITLTANLDYISFTFLEADKGGVVDIGLALSKKGFENEPPIKVSLKKIVTVRHFHSAGYYYND